MKINVQVEHIFIQKVFARNGLLQDPYLHFMIAQVSKKWDKNL